MNMSSKFQVPSSEFRVPSWGSEFPVPRTRNPEPGTSDLHGTRKLEHSPKSGFTLLELTVVLFILALATALIAPGFRRSFGQLPLRAATRDIAALCRYARTQAITHHGVLEVVLDRRTNTYWLRGPEWIVGRLGGIEQVAAVEDPEQPWQARMQQAHVRSLPAGITLKSVVLDTGPLRGDERGSIAF